MMSQGYRDIHGLEKGGRDALEVPIRQKTKKKNIYLLKKGWKRLELKTSDKI